MAPKALICGALLALAGFRPLAAVERPLDFIAASLWIESPYRNFREARQVLPGRISLIDEADDTSLQAALASEMRRLYADLYAKGGWRTPFAEGEALRVYVSRREANGLSRISARSAGKGLLFSPAILLDGSHLSESQIVREVARLVARATLSGYGAPDRTFLTDATAELLAVPRLDDEEREAALIAAAAPEVDIARNAAALGRLYVEEFVRDAGAGTLRDVFERASESGEELLPLFLRTYAEVTGQAEETLFLRFGARLYASLESDPGPSRIGLLDLQTGALDAAAPAAFALRHRTYLPADAPSALRVEWPEDGATGAAVLRYRDPALPPDVVFLSPGAVKTVPLSGVSRVDWIVAGNRAGVGPLAAPAFCEPVADFPFSGLVPQAAAAAEGPRLSWATASHRELLGWAVFREEVLSDGRIARTGPEVIPASLSAEEPFRYAYLDTASAPGVYYRYTVWAITAEGLLSRAFSATLRTPD